MDAHAFDKKQLPGSCETDSPVRSYRCATVRTYGRANLARHAKAANQSAFRAPREACTITDIRDAFMPKGNLARNGAGKNLSGMERLKLTGPARCFGSEELGFKAVTRGDYAEGEALAIRYEGPICGPGMREVPATATAIYGQGMGDKVALIADGRFSGATRGICIGHVSRKAAVSGPIGLIEDGNIIPIDAVEGTLDLQVSEDVLETRRKDWRTPNYSFAGGCIWKYAQTAGTAQEGTVTHPGGQAEVVCYADV